VCSLCHYVQLELDEPSMLCALICIRCDNACADLMLGVLVRVHAIRSLS